MAASLMEPARASLGVHGCQIEPARASQDARDSQRESTSVRQDATVSEMKSARMKWGAKGCHWRASQSERPSIKRRQRRKREHNTETRLADRYPQIGKYLTCLFHFIGGIYFLDFRVGREHLKYHLDGIWTNFGQFLVYNCRLQPNSSSSSSSSSY